MLSSQTNPDLNPQFSPQIPTMNPAQHPIPSRSSNQHHSTPPQNPASVTSQQAVGSGLPPEGATDLQLPAMENLQLAPASQVRPAASNSSAMQEPVIPRLELDMQSMSITSTEEEDQEENHQYILYMKLASSQGPPRILSLDIIQKQMQ
jgi:hypothetical protein